MFDVTYTKISPKQSSREGARIHGLVLHTTEGSDNTHGSPPADLVNLGELFQTKEASAHLGVNAEGKFARYVEDADKAWAVCNFNSVTLSLEQIGFAAFDKDKWFSRHPQLHGAARFLAYGHIQYGVPLEPGVVSGGAIVKAGVFQHKDLGLAGSGHVDCGPDYPQGYVTLLAKYFIAYKLHSGAPHTKALAKALNGIRRQYNIAPVA